MSDLSLEKLKVVERLNAIESAILLNGEKMASMEKTITLTLDGMNKMIEKHELAINGKPGEHVGLLINVDRLIGTERSRSWVIKGIVLAVVGIFLKSINWLNIFNQDK